MPGPVQSKASIQIYEAVPIFPKAVADLIGSYHTDPEDLALTRVNLKIAISLSGADIARRHEQSRTGPYPLLFGNPDDRAYCEAVKYCLTSTSCTPKIKSQIIKNLVSGDHVWDSNTDYLPTNSLVTRGLEVFDTMLLELREDARMVNLDWVDFSGMNLSRLTLDMISAVGASFVESDLHGASLRNADLTQANFSGANLRRAKLDGAKICNSILHHACFAKASMRQVDLTGAELRGTVISEYDEEVTDVTDLITSDPSFKEVVNSFTNDFCNLVFIRGEVSIPNIKNEKAVETKGKAVVTKGSTCVIN